MKRRKFTREFKLEAVRLIKGAECYRETAQGQCA
jgi:transposase-like protein